MYNSPVKNSKITRRQFLATLTALTATGSYGVFHYSNTLKITHRQINTGKLTKPLRIIHFADLHIGPLTRDEIINKAFKYIKTIEADIICFTGDVIHYGPQYADRIKEYFPAISAKHGNYCVLGNHDYVDGFHSKRIRNNFAKTDFKLLINEFDTIDFHGHKIFLCGTDDLWFGEKNYNKTFAFDKKDNISILLAHNSANIEFLTKYNPDVVLSGHTHGGQIYIPYLLNPVYKKFCNPKYLKGLFKVKDTYLFVTTGVGNGILKIPKIPALSVYRFLSPPEIAIITVL